MSHVKQQHPDWNGDRSLQGTATFGSQMVRAAFALNRPLMASVISAVKRKPSAQALGLFLFTQYLQALWPGIVSNIDRLATDGLTRHDVGRMEQLGYHVTLDPDVNVASQLLLASWGISDRSQILLDINVHDDIRNDNISPMGPFYLFLLKADGAPVCCH